MFDIYAFTIGSGKLSQLDQTGVLYGEVDVFKYCVTWRQNIVCKLGAQLANCRCNKFHGLCDFHADFFSAAVSTVV